MAPRDDFPASVKDALAKRAGYRCSYPECSIRTIGPSTESPSAVSSVGVAAHITAAAPRGPRYDRTISSSERQSYENGIWLCQLHAKIVDDDVQRFSVTTLQEWRHRAERTARHEMGAWDEQGSAIKSLTANPFGKIGVGRRTLILAGAGLVVSGGAAAALWQFTSSDGTLRPPKQARPRRCSFMSVLIMVC
jgi:hypothetical protein